MSIILIELLLQNKNGVFWLTDKDLYKKFSLKLKNIVLVSCNFTR